LITHHDKHFRRLRQSQTGQAPEESLAFLLSRRQREQGFVISHALTAPAGQNQAGRGWMDRRRGPLRHGRAQLLHHQ
jgi:hypothetical protein